MHLVELASALPACGAALVPARRAAGVLVALAGTLLRRVLVASLPGLMVLACRRAWCSWPALPAWWRCPGAGAVRCRRPSALGGVAT